MTTKHILELQHVSVQYNGIKALHDINLNISQGEIVALMGPNGAGKSTVLKAIFGLVPLSHGHLLWEDSIVRLVPHKIVKLGLSFVPQGRRVFSHLTVEENLEMAGFVVSDKSELQRRIKEAMEIFPILHDKRHQKSATLSGGQQQMLALARGLMTNPKVLLLDEPSLGLAPKVVKEVFDKVSEINQRHQTAIMIVEHNLKSLFKIAHRAYVLDKGQVVFEGPSHEVEKNDILKRVFLGKM